MLRGSLFTGALVELLGEIAARRRVGAGGAEEAIAVLNPLAALIASGCVGCSSEIAELGSSER